MTTTPPIRPETTAQPSPAEDKHSTTQSELPVAPVVSVEDNASISVETTERVEARTETTETTTAAIAEVITSLSDDADVSASSDTAETSETTNSPDDTSASVSSEETPITEETRIIGSADLSQGAETYIPEIAITDVLAKDGSSVIEPEPTIPGTPLPIENKQEKKANALVVTFKEIDSRADKWIRSWNPYHPDVVKERPLEAVIIEESKIRKKMARLFLIAFGLFMIWASFAPIDTGVTAQGTVMVSGYRKLLQHATGGVVQEIMVKEGQEVNAGDVLIRVNPLKAEAELTTAQLQYISALVAEARLMAERRGSKKITWPAELDSMSNDPRVVDAKNAQEKLFETRYKEFGAALIARRAQVQSLSEEAKSNADLAKEGFVSRSQSNQIERTRIEAEMSLNVLQATYYKDIDNQLIEIQRNKDALKARLDAVAYERDLTAIKSPVTGTIVGLKVHTVGGTISAGQILAEVVPKEAILMVDAQIPPHLVDKVKNGGIADMRFSSFNAAITPTVPGIVRYISPDRKPNDTPTLDDDNYLAQIEATPEGMAKLGSLQIQPGMPVDVIFKTGERTFLSYILKPLTDKMAKGFQDM